MCVDEGRKMADRAPVASRPETINIGTAQLTLTSWPKTILPRIAPIRPTTVRTPVAVDLQTEKHRPSKRETGSLTFKQRNRQLDLQTEKQAV